MISKSAFKVRATRNQELAVQWTSRLDRRATAKYSVDLRHAPVLFQEQVPKKAGELRVNVVGRKVFAAAIESQENVRISGDWRHYPESDRRAALLLFGRCPRPSGKLCVELTARARTVPGRDRGSHPHSLRRVCISSKRIRTRHVDLHRGIHRSPDRADAIAEMLIRGEA